MNFAGKVALVTGASRGIGRAIAEAFAAEGATVVVNYRRDGVAAAEVVDRCLALGGDAWACKADVGSETAVQAMLERALAEVGRIDVVVNNAFAPYAFDPEQRRAFDELGWGDYRARFDDAVGGAYQVCRAVLPHFKQRATGSIVNIVSDLVERPLVPYHDYATAKSALVGFSRNLAAELGPLGIRVNCVAPGLVHPTQGSRATREDFRDAIIAATPLRRIARPDDVAGAVLFFASDWSRFVTGQVLFVDGGLVMA